MSNWEAIGIFIVILIVLTIYLIMRNNAIYKKNLKKQQKENEQKNFQPYVDISVIQINDKEEEIPLAIDDPLFEKIEENENKQPTNIKENDKVNLQTIILEEQEKNQNTDSQENIKVDLQTLIKDEIAKENNEIIEILNNANESDKK